MSGELGSVGFGFAGFGFGLGFAGGPTRMIFGVDRYVEYQVESDSSFPAGANTLRSTDVVCAGAP